MTGTAGYSGTPLSRKLGIREGMVILARGAPANYRDLLRPLPGDVVFTTRLSARVDLVHLFETKAAALRKSLAGLRKTARQDAALWISWPKKASKEPTDITEDVIRAVAIPLGLVDIKVCAVDETWSGLKLVVRKSLRSA